MGETVHRTDRKFLLPRVGPAHDRKQYWEQAHVDEAYENVFSVGEDRAVRQHIVEAVVRNRCQRLLIAGCGSRTDLQEALIQSCPTDVEIVATDYPDVIELARSRFDHPRLTYRPLGEDAAYRGYFDAVVSVNVAVFDDDLTNRELFGEWALALRPGGRLIALLPILSCGYELATLGGRPELLQCLDLEQSTWHEQRQGIKQIEYLPLRLRRVVMEAGLQLEELRVVFLDGPRSREQTALYYGIEDPDVLVYEQLVVAVRRSSSAAAARGVTDGQ